MLQNCLKLNVIPLEQNETDKGNKKQINPTLGSKKSNLGLIHLGKY
jgi:hypothetical protein